MQIKESIEIIENLLEKSRLKMTIKKGILYPSLVHYTLSCEIINFLNDNNMNLQKFVLRIHENKENNIINFTVKLSDINNNDVFGCSMGVKTADELNAIFTYYIRNLEQSIDFQNTLREISYTRELSESFMRKHYIDLVENKS